MAKGGYRTAWKGLAENRMQLIPFLTLICIFIYYQAKNDGKYGVISLLLLTYIGMFIASFIIEITGTYHPVFPYNPVAMSYLAISFIILFSGYGIYKDKNIQYIIINNIYLYNFLEITLIVIGFGAIIFFSPFAWYSLSAENIGVQRIIFNNPDVQRQLLGKWGIINSVFSLGANLFLLAQICAFINLTQNHNKKKSRKALLLFASSLSYVVYILAYVGRDGIVYWSMSFVFCYMLFRDFFTIEQKNKIKKAFLLVLVMLAIPFFLISISRFSRHQYGLTWSLVNYYGQQVRNFNDHFLIEAPISYGQTGFPVFTNMMEAIGLSFGSEYLKEDMWLYFLREGVAPWVFSSFIGSFLRNFGKIGTWVALLIMSVSVGNIVRNVMRKKAFSFSNIIMFALFFQIPYWGVFYFRQYSDNYYIIIMFLLSISFKSAPACKKIIIKKVPKVLSKDVVI